MAGFTLFAIDEREDSDSATTSYADLFAALAFVFLFLYIISTLRSTVEAFAERLPAAEIAPAPDAPRLDYSRLTRQLEALEATALAESERLLAQAQGMQQREQQLVAKYRQALTHLEGANEALKGSLVAERGEKKELQSELAQAEQSIRKNAAQLDRLRSEQDALRRAQAELESQRGELAATLNAAQSELEQASRAHTAAEESATRLAAAKAEVEASLEQAREQIASLSESRKAAADERERLQAQLDKLGRERAAAQAAADQARQQLEDRARSLAELRDAQTKLQAQAQQLEREKRKTAEQLARTDDALRDYRDRDQFRNELIRNLDNALKGHDLPATVDPRTGEVTLRFKEYFDYDSSKLKPSMEKDLRRLIPVYAGALFETPNVRENIRNIEIIGFASPTYEGQYVNPASLHPEARTAVQYNLDLSYRRARSIFQYVLDRQVWTFPYQNELMRYLKVTGRGYLTAKPVPDSREPTLTKEEFCARYQCAEEQSALIRVNLITEGTTP